MTVPPAADVCLLLEGSYPYVAGGVSTWTHDLIQAYPDLTFHLVALVADRSTRAPRYQLPVNVTGLTHVYLQEPDRGWWWLPGRPALFRRLEPALRRMQRGGGQGALAEVLSVVAPLRGRLGRRILLNSEPAWALLVRMYRDDMPEASFLDYFWTWRALVGGMFATLLSPLPAARVYHAVSTGYAGLYAARAALETGRPALVTEHGIYTNERRIEILMAEWLFDGSATGLAIEKPRRDLRDLWLDTFASYSKACYDACDPIVTLYGGNQDFQRRQGADPTRLRIIPNGIDYAGYSRIERSRDHPPTVALIGRVVPIKDVKTFLRACARLRDDVPELCALIMGPTEEDPSYVEECRQLVQHLDLGATVRFTGRVTIADWLGRIDAIALTSVSEAMPLVVLEAGAAGVPTVATDVGACAELILGRGDETPALGAGGAITPLASPLDTARELAALLLDRAWRDQCGAVIRERVRRHYDKIAIDRRYRALYESCRQAPDRQRAPAEVA